MNSHPNPIRQGRHIIANGIRLHYVRFAAGRRPLIVLPGITSPAATWEFVAARLAKFSDVYVLDVRGRGLSQGGEGLGHSLDEYAADVHALADQLGLAAPDILGHSMGARIAIRLAAHHPASVGQLILVDPPVSGPGRRPYPIALDYYLESIQAVSHGEGLEDMRLRFKWTEEQLQDRMEWLPTCEPAAIRASHQSFLTEDIHQNLPDIKAHTLLMYAEQGGTVSDDDAQELIDGLGGPKRKLRIDGAGHMIPWDQLDAFVGAVEQFLQA